MNVTLSIILAALLAGIAITEFPETEELVQHEMDRHHAAQVEQAEQMAIAYGLNLEGEAAFNHFYEIAEVE